MVYNFDNSFIGRKKEKKMFFFTLFQIHTHVNCLNNEGIALMSFKQSIHEDPDGSMNNWNYSDESPCSWTGITCKDQKVISISIPKKKLIGLLSSSLGTLTELRHLNLRSNKLFGNLPIELFSVQGLQSLVLSGNSFSGSLPFEIGNLNYLQTLDLSENFFNFSLPLPLIQLKRLKGLDLSQNNFTGSLPNGFGANLVSLERLVLSHNMFSGLIPIDLGNLSKLQGNVDLSRNLFTGSIPPTLGNLPEKVYIDLSYNNLSGPIPQNGALINRGPTAFIGNPGLCGPPLKNPCSESESSSPPSIYPNVPGNYPPQETDGGDRSTSSKGLPRSGVVAIIVSDVIGICIVGLLFSYCYSRFCKFAKRIVVDDGYGFEKKDKGIKECLCFRRDEKSETLSNNAEEQYDLVALDNQVGFDLDELLKASAFVLGKSGIGIVYKVVLEDGLNLAVRRLGEGGTQRFKEFHTEVEAIGKLRHPNVVTLRAYYWSVDEKLLIYDYILNGNLAMAIHGKPGIESYMPLAWSVRLSIMHGTARGLAYLHEYSPKKYVHGDLNPSNILLGQNMEPKISDFGLGRLANIAGGSPTLQSSRMMKHQGHAPSEVATVASSSSSFWSYYQAPEASKAVKPSQKWDVYSYGVILLEMITGKSPVVQVGALEIDIVHWIQLCIEEKKPLSDVLDPYLGQDLDKEEEMIAILKISMACVHTSPEKRPSMRHVLEVFDKLSVSSYSS